MKQVGFLSAKGVEATNATPFKCWTDDGEYYVKFAQATSGPHELINEYVGYSLANIIGLSFPSPALVKCPQGLRLDFGDGRGPIEITTQFSFGSKLVTKAFSLFDPYQYLPKARDESKADFLSIILFDHLLENTDRDTNPSNTLFDLETKKIFFIDEGNIFGAGDLCNQFTLKEHASRDLSVSISKNGLYKAMFGTINMKEYESATRQRFSIFSNMDFKELLHGIPQEWCCSNDEIEACDYYLHKRFSSYNRMLDLIMGYGEKHE